MKELGQYFGSEYGARKLGDITWSHAVNSKGKLNIALRDPSVMFVESDICVSKSGIPIAAHPPQAESDLSFDSLVEGIRVSKKGLKLDFKSPSVVTPCLEALRDNPLSQPVILNADILQGNGAAPSQFNGGDFILMCQEYYPAGLLSLGWTTTADPSLYYTPDNINEMLELCKDVPQVTFPVRACLLPNSWDQVLRLLENDEHTLTIWNNEPISNELMHWIKTNTNPAKTFFDII